MAYTCQKCRSTYSRKDSLNRHSNSCKIQRNTDDKEKENGAIINNKRKAEPYEQPLIKNRKVQNKGKCNWCGYDKELLENKRNFARLVDPMEGNIIGAIGLYKKDFMESERMFATLVSHDGKITCSEVEM
jgi:hypothetical protein